MSVCVRAWEPPGTVAKGSGVGDWPVTSLTSNVSAVASAAGATNEMVSAPAEPVVRPTY